MTSCVTPLSVQTLMLSRTLKGDMLRGFDEIQQRVDSEHAQSESLSAEREALADKAKDLEARVVVLEGSTTICGCFRANLEIEVWVEWEISHSVAHVAWEAMEAFEGGNGGLRGRGGRSQRRASSTVPQRGDGCHPWVSLSHREGVPACRSGLREPLREGHLDDGLFYPTKGRV